MKRLMILLVMSVPLIWLIWPNLVEAEKVIIIGGWKSTVEELEFLHERMPGSVVAVPRQYLPLETAAVELYEQLKEELKTDDSVVFIAHSWGGLLARQLAVNYPEVNIRKIIMLGTPSGGYWFAPKWVFSIAEGERVPLFVIAGSKSVKKWSLGNENDGTVDVSSALAVEAKATRVFPLGHGELLVSEKVVQQIKIWLDQE